uniref:Reverse transcriptase domain-containing protein n=1 Tax=Tanacetum cinerariifolium TaxID=118510 RepID=A0A6L2K589_TANCI|nr:hypothetical protein [Tanacetum cinerariifolium]
MADKAVDDGESSVQENVQMKGENVSDVSERMHSFASLLNAERTLISVKLYVKAYQKRTKSNQNQTKTRSQSGNPTFSLHKEITSPEVIHVINDSKGCNFLSEELPDIDSFNDIHLHFDDDPLSGSATYSANSLLEEFVDKLALITYPPDYDDNRMCDIESDLREIEFLLYQGEDSDFKDSIDQTDLANLNDLFIDPTPEMFIDEQPPDYSFPPRFDVYPDDFLEIESDANFDDDSFDSKGEKIKEAELLIDQLDLPCDIIFEYDSFNSQDFSRDDNLPSPDNEDKDFDPLFYELLVFKEVPNSMKLLSFSSENEEKVFKPGIYISEKEFTDELALITYLPDYDDNLKCDIESDLKEIEFLLYQGKDSGLKDSIDQTDLANHDAYFVDPTTEMFTDEHAPDYSFPPRFGVYPNDFLEIKSDADNFYDNPFDSKGEKIKESELLIDELDLPYDILLYSEYDSFASQDFSRDDDLPSPDNEDKVFNPGILIHEKSVIIITRVAQEKKLAISYASLVFEDFDPPFYEPVVFKDELPDINSFNNIHLHFDDDPLSGSITYSANSLLEEFVDELALITYPPDYDDNRTCDIESDLREIEFLLYQGEDSDFKDSIDQTDLANLNDLFVDPTPEMFIDEQPPDYSFPPRFDVYPDDFLEIESDANFDDDSFDSNGDKIKEAKLLIDQLDLPYDILFAYDSFNSQDFSRDDNLPSPDNEDKVFNPEILIHEKSVSIITRVTQEKKLAISYASLLFEDFDPPFYELLVFKEVPNSMKLLPFSSENEEKVFKPGIYISEKVHFCFHPELSHPGFHVFKVNMIFISLMKIFHVQSGKNTPPLDVLLFYFYPP